MLSIGPTFLAHILFPLKPKQIISPFAKIAYTRWPSVTAVGAANPVSSDTSGGSGSLKGTFSTTLCHRISPVFASKQ